VRRNLQGDPLPQQMASSKSIMKSAGSESLPLMLILAAMLFNLFLCFANTHLFSITSLHVVVCEIVIVSAVMVGSWRQYDIGAVWLLFFVVLYLLFFSLVRSFNSNGAFDPKGIRDFVIPIAFFVLGRGVKDLRYADFVVTVCASVVLVFAVLEYAFPESYLNLFNIIGYYIARGSVEASRLEILSSNLFVSGIRPEGRTFFPFLGDHRVSSIFLEPVSLGNFGAVTFAWAVVRSRFEGKISWTLFTMSVLIIILADSRFAAYLCVLSVFAMLLPPSSWDYVVFCTFPILFVALLLISNVSGITIDNGLMGRLASSSQVLASFDVYNWLGLTNPTEPTLDAGYAYLINQMGLIGILAIWIIFSAIPSSSVQFHCFRLLVGFYLAALFCISYSPLTIKTASLLWFLLGTTYKVSNVQSVRDAPY
jgi:putative polymerase